MKLEEKLGLPIRAKILHWKQSEISAQTTVLTRKIIDIFTTHALKIAERTRNYN